MAGLGLGSFLSGRLLASRGRALRFFSACELGVGAYALLLPSLIAAAERVFTSTVGAAGFSHYQESLLKLILAFALLAVPTCLMGATLPLLASHAVERFSHLGFRVGSLYALNTLGAAVGCFLAGFYGVPLLGLRGTTAVAVSLNVAVGLGALTLERWQRGLTAPAAPEPAAGADDPAAPVYPAATARWALLAFAVSGFAGLGLEVVWTRLIGLVFLG